MFIEHSLDVFNSGEDFETWSELVALDEFDCGSEFVDDEFHPKFGRLMLDNEEHLIVVVGF